jgi:hypothetical protein
LAIGYDKTINDPPSWSRTMTPQLEQIYRDLDAITPIERWQVVEHLITQLKGSVVSQATTSSATLLPQPHLSAQEVFMATQGSWGNRSLDEIDAQLAEQRRFDWGE